MFHERNPNITVVIVDRRTFFDVANWKEGIFVLSSCMQSHHESTIRLPIQVSVLQVEICSVFH